MSGTKPKQQKSLLSFFSPPVNAGAKKATPSPAIASGGGAKSSSSKAKSSTSGATTNSSNSKKRPVPLPIAADADGAPRKRIEFSPKLKKPQPDDGDEQDNDDPMPSTDTSTSKHASSPAGTKRKAYEDFLGTSSEEDASDKDGGKKRPSKSGAAVAKTEVSPQTKSVRPSKVVVDDDDDSDSDNEKMGSAQSRTRRRITRNVVSSDEEWDPSRKTSGGANDDESEFSDDDGDEESDDDDGEDEEEEEEEKPARRRKKPTVVAAKKATTTPAKRTSGASFLSPPASSSAKKAPVTPSASLPSESTSSASGAGCHLHDSLAFLNERRRDANGNTPESPEFNPRTLLVPPEFLKKETPAMVQWWGVKALNMDTVLFFKVGKFYELFHMDADIGFKELGLIYMKGDKAHSGFPETAYAKMSSHLVSKGYRVARVEQTETPDMLKERNAGSATKAKVVRREICSLLSIGTNTNSYLDAPISSQERQIARKLVALKEDIDASSKTPRFGVCMADCATGAFHLAEFDDTEQRDRLKTMFAQFHVVEVVTERFGLSDDSKQVLKHAAPSAIRSELRVGKEFWDASRTVDEIERAGYFREQGWPAEVLACLEVDKTVRADAQLAISALGGCIWHLRRSIIDQELLSLGNFARYKPSDEEAREQIHNSGGDAALASARAELAQHYVVLDSQTLHNLEILTNNFNGSRAGSLIDILDKTVTSFGKRLFQDWVVKPLCQVSEINERLDAVEQLGQQHELVTEVRSCLRKLPDLERLLSRIHALGSVYRSTEHPDSRAIMYESKTYNIRKIRNFLAVLNGFGVAMDLVRSFGPRFAQFTSPILQVILKARDVDANGSSGDVSAQDGQFPDLRAKLEYFTYSFDQSVAKESGVIVPPEGFDPEFDNACADIVRVQDELQTYLEEQRKALRCKGITYWGAKKEDRYQLEVPESAVSAHQPREYELKSRKKGYKRFHTPTIRDLLAQLAAAETRKDDALRDQMRRVFHKFDEDYRFWMKAVQCLAVLDCLLGLALVSSQSDGFTKPEVVSAAMGNHGVAFIDIEDGVHPCVAQTFDGDFIPNDAQLGVRDRGQMILLSGPNMGGKSTLLRQTCVLALMAQIGCFVPAQKCRLSPVDRIFTRIGASDRILAGQSTLYVELAETATILQHATRHSLVILDELGRGTSTFDGTAIAYSVVEHLLHQIKCRAMFATHYHSLVEEYTDSSLVSLGHMGCIVDPANDRKVTFLYKLEDGMCPKSYGLNVAMLAKLPDEVIESAARKSEQFETSLQRKLAEHEADAAALVRTVQRLLQQSSGVDMTELTAAWTQLQRSQQRASGKA